MPAWTTKLGCKNKLIENRRKPQLRRDFPAKNRYIRRECLK